jgi:hypothetical protein
VMVEAVDSMAGLSLPSHCTHADCRFVEFSSVPEGNLDDGGLVHMANDRLGP